MSDKKFIYKPSAVDQMIAFIFLLAAIAFIGLIYLDAEEKFPGQQAPAGDIRDLEIRKAELEKKLGELKQQDS